MYIFADMKQTIEDYIRENEAFRQALLKQEGGIMKYWAEHPNADGIDVLRKGYRDKCAHDYREEHKWSMSEEYIKREALANEHIKKELTYLETLKRVLSISFPEVAEQIIVFIEGYIDYAFREWRRNCFPEGVPPQKFHMEVEAAYSSPFGVAVRCLMRVLREYRNIVDVEKDEYDLLDENDIQQYAKIYYVGCKKLRQAVKEMIDENTRNMTEKESRRMCRKLTLDMMQKVRYFSRMVNSDHDYLTVDFTTGECKISITKEEMAWLRLGMKYRDTSPNKTASNGRKSLEECFSRYYHVLTWIGRIWAAQLLLHGIDMRELEKETNIILNRDTSLLYYVDKFPDDHRGNCCVYDMLEAKELLLKIKLVNNPLEELITDNLQPYWKKLREKKFIVEYGYALAEGVSPYDATYIADHFGAVLKLRYKWKCFQQLWGLRNMAQYKNDYTNKTTKVPHQKEIDEIFGARIIKKKN